ncbi:4Fe-4S cluster-binding domain-containing protein, partial [Klebsiella pasteurii]
MRTGLISRIQRYSTKDGPGIRSTVFMQQCNLRCQWCANPETIRPGFNVFWFKERCRQCG